MVDLLFARSTVATRDAARFGKKCLYDRRHAGAARACRSDHMTTDNRWQQACGGNRRSGLFAPTPNYRVVMITGA
jgi:hypothetical protein